MQICVNYFSTRLVKARFQNLLENYLLPITRVRISIGFLKSTEQHSREGKVPSNGWLMGNSWLSYAETRKCSSARIRVYIYIYIDDIPFDTIRFARSQLLNSTYPASFTTWPVQRKITWKVAAQFRSELQMREAFSGSTHTYKFTFRLPSVPGTKQIRSSSKIHLLHLETLSLPWKFTVVQLA